MSFWAGLHAIPIQTDAGQILDSTYGNVSEKTNNFRQPSLNLLHFQISDRSTALQKITCPWRHRRNARKSLRKAQTWRAKGNRSKRLIVSRIHQPCINSDAGPRTPPASPERRKTHPSDGQSAGRQAWEHRTGLKTGPRSIHQPHMSSKRLQPACRSMMIFMICHVPSCGAKSTRRLALQ
jgi:hypothetical protein